MLCRTTKQKKGEFAGDFSMLWGVLIPLRSFKMNAEHFPHALESLRFSSAKQGLFILAK